MRNLVPPQHKSTAQVKKAETKPKKATKKAAALRNTEQRSQTVWVGKIGSVRVRRLKIHISTEKSSGDSRCECGQAEAAHLVVLFA